MHNKDYGPKVRLRGLDAPYLEEPFSVGCVKSSQTHHIAERYCHALPKKNCKLQNANFKFAICILQFAISPGGVDRRFERAILRRRRAGFETTAASPCRS